MTDTIGSIIRIDKPKHSQNGTHGWQVRLPSGTPHKYYSKLFSDNLHGGKEAALLVAEEYRRQQLQQHPELYQRLLDNLPPYYKEPSERNKSGRVGVFRSHSYHGKTKRKQEFWAVFCPVGPFGKHWTKRYYIVTHGEEEARRLATEFREMWEEAAEKGTEAVEEFFEIYYDAPLNL